MDDLPFIEAFILVGWSPADWTFVEPAGYEPVATHLLGVEKFLHLPIFKVWTWRPTEKEVEALPFCARYGNFEDVKKNLLCDLHRSFKRLKLPTRPAAPPLHETLSRFLKLIATSEQLDGSVYGAARELLKSIHVHLVEPSIDQQDSGWKGLEGLERTAAVLLACDGLEQLINRQVRRMRRGQGALGLDDPESERDELTSILQRLDPVRAIVRKKTTWLPKLQKARKQWNRSRR